MLKRPNPLEKSPLWPKSEPVSKKRVRRSRWSDDPSFGMKVFLGSLLFLLGLLFFVIASTNAANRTWLSVAGIACCTYPWLFRFQIVYEISLALIFVVLGAFCLLRVFAGAVRADYLFATMGCAMFVLAIRLAPNKTDGWWMVARVSLVCASLAVIGFSIAILTLFGAACVIGGIYGIGVVVRNHLRATKQVEDISPVQRGKTQGQSWIAISAAAVLIAAFLTWVITDVDAGPQARVGGVVILPLNIRSPIAKLCLNDSTIPELRALRLIASRERFPEGTLGYDMKITGAGSVMLTFVMKEMLWESALRYHSTAIPAGAKIVFEGRCTGANRFAWSLHRSTTVPAALFPEFGGEFAVNN